MSPDGTVDKRGCGEWGLYVITDAAIAGRTNADIVRLALAGGARVVQLRDKNATFEQLLEAGREIRRLTREHNATFIVNDNAYLARDVEADGVHIGQSDLPPDIAREIIGDDKIVGLSTHNRQQVLEARGLPVDYIGIGPVYPTSTKKSEWHAVGPTLIRWACENTSLPVVGIGGITMELIPEVIAAGARNVAVIGDLVKHADIEGRTQQMCGVVSQCLARQAQVSGSNP